MALLIKKNNNNAVGPPDPLNNRHMNTTQGLNQCKLNKMIPGFHQYLEDYVKEREGVGSLLYI